MAIINFHIFDMNMLTRNPEKVTGTFNIGPKEYTLTMPMVAQIGNEDLKSAYRRELMRVRDALSDLIESTDGIQSLGVGSRSILIRFACWDHSRQRR